jgi:hypothetical protein
VDVIVRRRQLPPTSLTAWEPLFDQWLFWDANPFLWDGFS